MSSNLAIARRDFLKLAGAAAAAGVTHTALAAPRPHIAILLDTTDPTIASAPVRWAAEKLQRALTASGATATIIVLTTSSPAASAATIVVVTRDGSDLARQFPTPTSPLHAAESLRLTPAQFAGSPATWLSAIDQRGFIYGLLELAERVQAGPDASTALHLTATLEDRPANPIRSVARAFISEIEDKVWFYDKDLWRSYLDLLVASRFNRFNFALGFGYDFPRGVTGDYLHFPYPYLVDVPGYKVSVVPHLADGERDHNFEMLRFIAAETVARGLQFQLGLWSHAYQWTDSPHSDHHIEGLNAETHAPYCRDALAILLKECPEIQGVTLRVHGESGIPEGSYPFWQTLFEAIAACGRTVEIDMHAKGINQIMIDMAVKTGMPVKVAPKYAAEHQSLGYHQADIRDLEIPRADRMETGVFNVSNGERRFTRYGYADLFTADRRYDILFRLWPGTQRHLLSADPAMAAAYGRTAHFCGAAGIELCEPLTFKGREGSGQPGGRCAYADTSLTPKQGDFQKFEYNYRLWGRLLYNPDANPETWRRSLRRDFGPGTRAVEDALANASRVLPLLTSAHLPSASNHALWYEIYDNMPIVAGAEHSPYGDTQSPKIFNTVSPLDPQLFSSIVEHTEDLLAGHPGAKYSPVEVAQWLEDFTAAASRALTLARAQASSPKSPVFRRFEEDVIIQIGMGRFFTAKLRSGMLFQIYQQTHDPAAGRLALAEYRKARAAWQSMAQRAASVYRSDIAYGDIPQRRGHWIDRLPAIDRDIVAMEASLTHEPSAIPSAAVNAAAAVTAITARPNRPTPACHHTPPSTFQPGQPLPVSFQLPSATGPNSPTAIHLFYRHVNHAERWKSMPMDHHQDVFQASIPAEYTHSQFPLQYYFEIQGPTAASFHPAFNSTLSNQPYYTVSRL